MLPIELKDFLGFRYLSALSLSPDGTMAAFLVREAAEADNNYRCDLYLHHLDTDRTVRLTRRETVHAFAWSGERAILFSVQQGQSTAFYDLPVDGGAAVKLGEVGQKAQLAGVSPQGEIVLTYDRLLGDGHGEKDRFLVLDEYPFWYNGRGLLNKVRRCICLYNPQDGSMRQITGPLFKTDGVACDWATRSILYHGQSYDKLGTYKTGAYLYNLDKDEETCLLPDGEYHIDQVAFWNGTPVVAGSKLDRSIVQCPDLVLIDPATRQRHVLATGERGIGNPVVTDSRLGEGLCMADGGEHLYFLSGVESSSHILAMKADGSVETVLGGSGSVDMLDVSGGRMVMVGMKDMRLQELYEVKDGACRRLTGFNEDFYRQRRVAAPQPLFFRNAVGDQIQGFVLPPADYDPARSYPMILDIHGGPHLAYGEVYCHEMQLWAARGYFVAYANPTGSDGFGEAFGTLCGRFGTVDYDDLMQFVDEVLAAYPAIDPARLGVAGGSYGGFMTNWIIGHTRRFAAAASQRSISNFITMEGMSDVGIEFTQMQMLAGTFRDLERTWDQSPLKYAEDARTPTLFLHAEEDYRCPYVESLQMFTALGMDGVDARMCLFKGENHELSRSGRPRSRIKRLEELTAWFDRYLQG